jgi:hypothetical protein
MAHMGVNRRAYRILVGKLERKRLHGRCEHSCEAKNRTNRKEIEWENMAQDRDKRQSPVRMVMNFQVP